MNEQVTSCKKLIATQCSDMLHVFLQGNTVVPTKVSIARTKLPKKLSTVKKALISERCL